MNTIEPRIAGLTPSVRARSQKTISGPNSASAKRAIATSLDTSPPASGVAFGHRRKDRLHRLGLINDSHMVDAGKNRQRNPERRLCTFVSLRVHELVVGAGDNRNPPLSPLEGPLPVGRRGIVAHQTERVLAG